MTSDTVSDVMNRLQVVSFALESIEEETPRSIVIQRTQNCLKQIHLIKKLIQNATDSELHAQVGQSRDATKEYL